MLVVLGAMVLGLAVCARSLSFSYPVDCAYSVWSEWTLDSSGRTEIRMRHIVRQAQNDGRSCRGRIEQHRSPGAQPLTTPDEFFGNVLAGNAPSYSLGGGRRYTLSRDIVLVLDNTVDPNLFTYYKPFISNIVGAFCGDIGKRPQDNRLNVVSLGNDAVQIHSFNDDQTREVIQSKILALNRSHSQADLQAVADYARNALYSDYSGTRSYNNATKEVLFMTSDRADCPEALSAAELKTTAEVYVIVLGRETAQRSCSKTLASSPVESHFLRLEGITEISEQSQVLSAQSPVNSFCLSSN